MKMRKVVSAMLVAAMATGMVAGCGSSSDSKSDKKDAKGKSSCADCECTGRLYLFLFRVYRRGKR